MMTLRQLLYQGIRQLEEAKVPDASYDAGELLEHALQIERSYYFLHENDTITKEQQDAYEKVICLRAQRIPLQHITGTAWFMGYGFYVNSHVLTPRFDTEILVEKTGQLIKPGMRILDLCTGSGCILLSLLAEHQGMNLKGVGVDISQEALKVAEENKKRLGMEAELLESDLFTKVEGTFDIIVSNPPYIATKELAGLMPEVREHEPWLALDGKEDGLYFYKKIVQQAEEYLTPDGWLCFEIGYDQGEALRDLLTDAEYENVQICKDLAGLERVAMGQKVKR